MRHKYNTTAAYEIFFFSFSKSENLSHIIRTLKKSLLQLVLLLIPNQPSSTKKKEQQQQHTSSCYAQCTVYHEGKTKEKIIPHLTQITENNCFKEF